MCKPCDCTICKLSYCTLHNARPVIDNADGVSVLDGAQRNEGAVIGGGMLIGLGLLALLGAAYVTMRKRGN